MRKLLTLLTLSIVLLSVCPLFSTAHALPADSMWIVPPTLNFNTNSTSAGYKFNVTIWLNMSTPANAWQFYLIYNKNQLNATRCGYTGNGHSQWSGGKPVYAFPPTFGSHNSTYNYVFHGEVLQNEAEGTGTGSLSWVEFQIIQAPAQGMTLKSELRLDVHGIQYTYIINASLKKLPVSFGKSTYTFSTPTSGLVGDITGPKGVPDGIVDTRDLALVARCYGAIPGASNWDPRADITGPTYLVPDGLVDTRDLALVAKHYGDHL
jgi:hypothetical protein